MKNNIFAYFLLFSIIIFSQSCKPRLVGETYDPPGSTDTRNKTIALQTRATYTQDDVFASNEFIGARLNGFEKVSPQTYKAMILPENHPINNSAWYAFKLWSPKSQTITLNLTYRHGKHRYYPKTSTNGQTWARLDTAKFEKLNDTTATLILDIGTDTLWVAAQELKTSKETKTWANKLSEQPHVFVETVGESKLGRPMTMMTVMNEKARAKNVIIVLGRQHPPEVTGHLAMEAFVETVASDSDLAKRFREQFQVLVFPLVNPDGVDNGHWRHSAGGIDLNRDWVNFHQEETSAIKKFLTKRIKGDMKVWFGFDFHSTSEDILYTILDSVVPRQNSVVQPWLNGIKERMPEDEWYEEPYDITSPISKNWIYKTFNAEAVTYEVGDEMDRDYLKKKARISAEVMMEVLLDKVK